MIMRNLRYNSLGSIDCEIDHQVFGWIPFTASASDSEPQGRQAYEAAIAGIYGAIAPYDAPQPKTTDIHREKHTAINEACEAAITAGFTSDALGSSHLYASQLDDQLNLTGAVLRGLDMPYACRDEQGVKDFRMHTAEQLRHVGDDFTLYKLQLLQHANALKQQLDAALDDGDLVALESITWEAPQS